MSDGAEWQDVEEFFRDGNQVTYSQNALSYSQDNINQQNQFYQQTYYQPTKSIFSTNSTITSSHTILPTITSPDMFKYFFIIRLY